MRLSILPFLSFLSFPFDALGPRGGPYFLPLQKVGKDRRKGVSPPCESPDQSGVLDAPLWKPPSLAALSGLAELLAASRLELRCRWGKCERVRARHDCRTSTASGWGLRPLAPQGSQMGTFAGHARQRMGQRSKRLLRRSLRKSPGSSCREAARSSVTSLARLWPKATLARPPVGESQRGRSPLWPVFAYFLLARK